MPEIKLQSPYAIIQPNHPHTQRDHQLHQRPSHKVEYQACNIRQYEATAAYPIQSHPCLLQGTQHQCQAILLDEATEEER